MITGILILSTTLGLMFLTKKFIKKQNNENFEFVYLKDTKDETSVKSKKIKNVFFSYCKYTSIITIDITNDKDSIICTGQLTDDFIEHILSKLYTKNQIDIIKMDYNLFITYLYKLKYSI